MAICAYPQLIAAYHVLLRLLMPRHSPCALLSLIFFVSILVLVFEIVLPFEFFRIRQKKPFSFTSLYPFTYSIFKVL